MASSRPLDNDTLDRLVRCLSDLGVAGITDREHGLSTNEIRSLTSDVPASLPSEVQLWFSRWTWGEELYDMLPRLRYHPLPNCVFLYDQALEMARLHRQGVAQARSGQTPAGYEPTWLPLWFPLSQKEGPIYVAVDLSASDRDIAPVLEVDNGGGDATRIARSLGEYVTRWLDEIDAGGWLYDREDHIWEPKGGWSSWAERHG